MRVIFEVLQNVKNTREATERAKDFFAWVFESDFDPIDEEDPLNSSQLFAVQFYFLHEYDEAE